MHHPFVPLLVLVWIPLAVACGWLGMLQRPAGRWVLLAGGAAVIAVSVWSGGVDFLYLDRMKLFVAGATAIAVWLHHRGAALRGRDYRLTLFILALTAWMVHLNFFSFHGARTFMHVHDVAHYYLGSKYFAELGYGKLYIAMLRAEAERYDDHFKAIEARDLETQGLVHIRVLLERSEPVKARFSPRRWSDFTEDVAFFREAMGSQYGEILQDHGFNPTPFWALLGGTLANLVPAGSHHGILLLTFLDPLLVIALFGLLGWTFGLEVMLLCMVYFCVLFGASFGYTGGAYLRYMWLFGVIAATCFVRRERYALAGMLFAWSAMLRIFPVLFVVPIAFKAEQSFRRTRRLAAPYARLLISFLATGSVLLASTLWVPRGLDQWREFSVNTAQHLASNAYNAVGLTEILAYRGATQPTTPDEFARTTRRRARIHVIQLLTVLPLVLLFVRRRCGEEDDSGAISLGVLLVFSSLSLASYYYVFLLLLVLTRSRDLTSIALMFAAEAMMYSVSLFEDREVVRYVYHDVLLFYLLLALYPPWRARSRPAFDGSLEDSQSPQSGRLNHHSSFAGALAR